MASEKNEVVDFCREGGPEVGDVVFWDGTEWICLPAGVEGQILIVGLSGTPEWQDPPA